MFGHTVREASETVRVAVEQVLLVQGIADLKAANAMIAPMAEIYGAPSFDWSNARRPIEFAAIANPREAAKLSDEVIADYEASIDHLMLDLQPVLYALRIENDLLQQYAERQAVDVASLLDLSGDANKANKRLVDSLVYETASLILSRMLTIRFCEDHDLFQIRYISNGGIEIFWKFAEHFSLPMQELLRQSYKHAGTVFRSIFDANILDWAISRDDMILSDALLRAAYILSRWDFKTVRGDILSGVYDQYLDVAQRRRLGEVYTRPEIARFMLEKAGWSPQSTLLDPACGTGTFLVEALTQRLDALDTAGAINSDTVREVIGQGLLGEPMGEWSTTAQRENTRYIYSYASHLSYERTFAAREISQLPTIAKLKPGQGFQNTAHMFELSEDFPLHSFVLSRIIQFYAARVLRSSIIEDFGCHWYKRTLTLLPIPADRSAEAVEELTIAGQRVLDADSDVANQYRAIDELLHIGAAGSSMLASLIVNADPVANGIDLNGASENGVGVTKIEETLTGIQSSDLFFSVTVPDADLRTFIAFVLGRQIEDDPEALLTRQDILDIIVPANLKDVVIAIRTLTTACLASNYIEALSELDAVVAKRCGISAAHRDYMIDAMMNDPILSKMRPMIAQRGLRIQPYADHAAGGRYDWPSPRRCRPVCAR